MQTIERVLIEFIPHDSQRYDTCGDWAYDGTTLVLRVSHLPDRRHEQLVAVHELAEALACNVDGVTQDAVDDFDMGAGAELDEPGDSPDAPYHAQHVMAGGIERRLAEAMGVEWADYEAAIDALPEFKPG
jgi:hypothetical protein